MASPQDNAQFIVAVDDFGGVWPVIREAVQSRLPLKQLLLRNKFGNLVPVHQLNLQFLQSSSERVQRLKPYTSSPVTWFRSPFAQLCLVTGEDVDDFKRAAKQQIRPLLDRDRDPLSGEWIFAYLRPLGSDPTSKGARKVFEALRSEFNTRKRDRCVRLEALGPRNVVTGLEELDRLIKEAVVATFEARAKAYDQEVRKLMAGRQEQGWKFATLFLVKDSLGVMLEAAGLLEDALREYFELEACFLEALSEGGVLAGHAFGGLSFGEDNAALLHAGWGQTRTNVHGAGLDAFRFRQYLFACQARLLMQLQRPIEVAERGLKFVQSFAGLLTRRAELPQLFKEAWAFSACLALAGVATRMAPPPPTPNAAATGASGGTPIGLASSWRLHRRSTSEFVQRVSNGSTGNLAGANGAVQMPRSLSANDLHEQASSRDDSTAVSLTGSSPSSSPMRRMQEPSESGSSETEDARMLNRQHSLARIRTKARGSVVAERALEGSHSSLRPSSARALDGRRSLERRSSRNGERERHRELEASPPKPLPPPPPEVDWDLGLPAELDGDWAEAEWGASGLPETGPPDTGGEPLGQSARLFYCLLGHLYAAARQELVHMASHLEVAASLPPSSPSHNPGVAPLNFPPASMVPMNTIADLHVAASAPSPSTSTHTTPQESPDRHHIGLSSLPSAESALPPPPVVSGSMARFATQLGSSLHKRSDSATSLASTPQDHGHTTLANAPPSFFGGPVRRPSRGDSIGAESDFGDASSVASEPESTISERPRGVLPPRIPTHPGATRLSGPTLAGMSDADLAAVELRVGTIAANGAADHSEPSSQQSKGSPLANGATDPLFIPGDKKTGPQVKLPFGSAAVPPWLSHWRLKLALSSASQYQELWVELSLAAAACYGAAGRTRNAALLRAEVGEALAGAGAPGPAAQALARQAGMFLDQRWPRLAATLLPRLASCHRSLSQVTPPAICLQILSLPPHVHPFLNRVTVQAELLRAAANPPANGGALAHMQNAPPVLNSQASMPIMLGSLMRHNSVASFRSSQKSPEAGAEGSSAVDALSAVWAQPVRGTYSRFFGQTGLAEEPILAPAPGDAPGQEGAADASVGDIITVPVDVYSRLPMELPAHTAILVLCVLQEMKLVFSPRTAAAIEQDPSLAVAPTHLRTSTVGSFTPSMQQLDQSFEAGMSARGADIGPNFDDPEGTASRFGTRWQETEDVACTLVGVSHDPHAMDMRSSSSPRTSIPSQKALSEDRELSPQLQRVLSGSFAGPGPKSLHQAESLLRPPRSAFRTSSDEASAALVVLPGYNRLFFQARPLKRGLYSLHHVALHIGKLQLILSPHSPPWDPAQPPKPPVLPLVERKGGAAPKIPPLGHVDPSGRLREAAVLLNVQSCRPRLAIAAVAQQGMLIAGQRQWLGLLIQPLHDRLRHLALHFACEQAPPGRGGSNAGEWGSPGGGASGSMPKWRGSHGSLQVGLEAPEGSSVHCVSLPGGSSEAGQDDDASGTARVAEDQAYGPGWSTVAGLPQPRTGILAPPSVLLLWLHVLAGQAPTQRETIKVQPPGPPPLTSSNRPQSALPSEGGLVLSPRTQRHPHSTPSAVAHPPCLTHMDVCAEYTAGCSRAHAARLSIPVTNPFRVQVVAREVMQGRVSLQARVTSQLPWPAVLTSAALALQSGFALECDLAQAANLLPCRVMPGATVALSSLVRARSTTPTAQGSHCSLSLHYSLQPQQQQQQHSTSVPDLDMSAAARVQQVAGEWGKLPLELGAGSSLPQPPGACWQASEMAEQDEGGTADANNSSSSGSMQHQFVLEMASMSGPPQTSVQVHLLGPFTARAGQPVTLCWRIERCRHGPQPLHTQLLQYDVLLKGEGWHGEGVLRGSVPLPADPQATATVEATAVPEVAGSLTVPQLNLRDVPYEETFEAGHSNDYIIVQP